MKISVSLFIFLLSLNFASAQEQVTLSLLDVLSSIGYTNCKLGMIEYKIIYDRTEGSVEVSCRENSMTLDFSGEEGASVFQTRINGHPYQFKAGTERPF